MTSRDSAEHSVADDFAWKRKNQIMVQMQRFLPVARDGMHVDPYQNRIAGRLIRAGFFNHLTPGDTRDLRIQVRNVRPAAASARVCRDAPRAPACAWD